MGLKIDKWKLQGRPQIEISLTYPAPESEAGWERPRSRPRSGSGQREPVRGPLRNPRGPSGAERARARLPGAHSAARQPAPPAPLGSETRGWAAASSERPEKIGGLFRFKKQTNKRKKESEKEGERKEARKKKGRGFQLDGGPPPGGWLGSAVPPLGSDAGWGFPRNNGRNFGVNRLWRKEKKVGHNFTSKEQATPSRRTHVGNLSNNGQAINKTWTMWLCQILPVYWKKKKKM
ncbi:uncharacterized protein LOC133048466 [Dama dama]|uniref:uncharacterized protein LOC133048466 n=1 Tax=Dama dama TaxID=30532 RepID=UPI002A36D073|nr:uncharacterized protein LOC133048466 [Dama dama]